MLVTLPDWKDKILLLWTGVIIIWLWFSIKSLSFLGRSILISGVDGLTGVSEYVL